MNTIDPFFIKHKDYSSAKKTLAFGLSITIVMIAMGVIGTLSLQASTHQLPAHLSFLQPLQILPTNLALVMKTLGIMMGTFSGFMTMILVGAECILPPKKDELPPPEFELGGSTHSSSYHPLNNIELDNKLNNQIES